MRILVHRHARLRGPWPLPPRQPMAVVLRAGRGIIVDLRRGARPLRGPGGGRESGLGCLPKSLWGNWAGQRTAKAPHAIRRQERWSVHVAKTTSAESRSLVREARQTKLWLWGEHLLARDCPGVRAEFR